MQSAFDCALLKSSLEVCQCETVNTSWDLTSIPLCWASSCSIARSLYLCVCGCERMFDARMHAQACHCVRGRDGSRPVMSWPIVHGKPTMFNLRAFLSSLNQCWSGVGFQETRMSLSSTFFVCLITGLLLPWALFSQLRVHSPNTVHRQCDRTDPILCSPVLYCVITLYLHNELGYMFEMDTSAGESRSIIRGWG